MKIFFDFDDFFLNEHLMLEDLFSVLEKATGADDKTVREVSSKFSGANFDKREMYTPKRNIELLRERFDFDLQEALQEVMSFFTDFRKYLFDGAEDFLKKFSKEDMYLLTYGDTEYQNRKVDISGLKKYFREVIVVHGNKLDEIERVARRDGFDLDETIVFADNRCGYFTGAKERDIITIHLKRDTDKRSKEPCGECQYTVEDFNGLLEQLSVLKNKIAK